MSFIKPETWVRFVGGPEHWFDRWTCNWQSQPYFIRPFARCVLCYRLLPVDRFWHASAAHLEAFPSMMREPCPN